MEHLCWAELSQRSRGFSEKENVRNTKTFCSVIYHSAIPSFWLHYLHYEPSVASLITVSKISQLVYKAASQTVIQLVKPVTDNNAPLIVTTP